MPYKDTESLKSASTSINSISYVLPLMRRSGETGFERYFEDNEENRYIWGENSIRNILRSPIYAGNLAGYKRISPA